MWVVFFRDCFIIIFVVTESIVAPSTYGIKDLEKDKVYKMHTKHGPFFK